jgi:hypothetical protein
MLKKHMVPLNKGGQAIAHAGKGSMQAPMSARNSVTQSGSSLPGAGMNNYAKATPMANPTPSATPDGGLGSGDWPGIGQ